MKTDDEGAPGQITSKQYRELRALFEYWEGYQLKLRRDLRTVEPLLDCLESKALGRPPIHLGWDPLLTALEEWNEPLYENLPLPDPLEPPPWDPRAARSSARDSTD